MTTGHVKTRVAPSPTGDPHVGTAYQALFNMVFARSRGGNFVLRIEDTDRARSTRESENAILRSLRWLGIEWDEGPDVGGPNGPYRQSERLEIYREHVDRLLESGHAYYSFLSPDQLDTLRAELRARGGTEALRDHEGRSLSLAAARRRVEAGEPHVVRLRVPTEGECAFTDLLRGEIRKDWASVDDQVLLKSDGFPTYHLANVVDDHLMGITHVIRGEEWINSVPKHVLLYDAFGWERPVFCHLPLLRNPDRSKLSKRRNPTSIEYYRQAGFLPEALLNFLGMLGWSMPGGEEKFTIEEMIEHFRLEDIRLGGPVFDVRKLKWLNGRYIREDHDTRRLLARLKEWRFDDRTLLAIAALVQPRLETLADWGYKTAFFFADEVPLDPADLAIRDREAADVAKILQMCLWRLEQVRAFTADNLEEVFRELAEKLDLKTRDLTRPFYVALTGKKAATPLYQSMEILGADMVRMRLRRAISELGGLSAKKLKALEKEYASLFGPRP